MLRGGTGNRQVEKGKKIFLPSPDAGEGLGVRFFKPDKSDVVIVFMF